MSLPPYILDYEISPRRGSISDHLNLDLSPEIFISDTTDGPIRRYSTPWRHFSYIERDIGSTIKSDKDKFQVNLDVQHFSPEEITVKVSDNCVVIEGKHEEKKDEHGFISRQFKRRYTLPEDCKAESVESKLSSDGVLSITAHKIALGERVVPIAQTGPIRRKLHDPDEKEQPNGETEEQMKSPQKKRNG